MSSERSLTDREFRPHWTGAVGCLVLAGPVHPLARNLGQAIAYMLRHGIPLTRFLEEPGCPLDNNLAEQGLKRAIMHRKNGLLHPSGWCCFNKSAYAANWPGIVCLRGRDHAHRSASLVRAPRLADDSPLGLYGGAGWS